MWLEPNNNNFMPNLVWLNENHFLWDSFLFPSVPMEEEEIRNRPEEINNKMNPNI